MGREDGEGGEDGEDGEEGESIKTYAPSVLSGRTREGKGKWYSLDPEIHFNCFTEVVEILLHVVSKINIGGREGGRG